MEWTLLQPVTVAEYDPVTFEPVPGGLARPGTVIGRGRADGADVVFVEVRRFLSSSLLVFRAADGRPWRDRKRRAGAREWCLLPGRRSPRPARAATGCGSSGTAGTQSRGVNVSEQQQAGNQSTQEYVRVTAAPDFAG